MFRPPEPLRPSHDLTGFENGSHASLDSWLRQRAIAAEGASARTYVVCSSDEANRVIGYYALATASAQRSVLPTAKLRQGMPDEIPLMLIARLAVDLRWRGAGLGSSLLADALRRCLDISGRIGVRGVVAHAIDDAAALFYARRGFLRAPIGERTMLMPIENVARYLG